MTNPLINEWLHKIKMLICLIVSVSNKHIAQHNNQYY